METPASSGSEGPSQEHPAAVRHRRQVWQHRGRGTLRPNAQGRVYTPNRYPAEARSYATRIEAASGLVQRTPASRIPGRQDTERNVPRSSRSQRGTAYRAETALATNGPLCSAGGAHRRQGWKEGRTSRPPPCRPEAPADCSTAPGCVVARRIRSRTATARATLTRKACVLASVVSLLLPHPPPDSTRHVPLSDTKSHRPDPALGNA